MNKKTKLVYFHELKVPLAFVKSIYEDIVLTHERDRLEQSEKERIQKIVKLCKSTEKRNLQIVCRDVLKFKVRPRKNYHSYSIRNKDYYVVPIKYTVEHFLQAFLQAAAINNKPLKEANPFLNNFKANKKKDNLNHKELLKPKITENEEEDFVNEELIKLPEIQISKKSDSKSTLEKKEVVHLKGGNYAPIKISKNVTLTNRDQSIVKQLKQLYNNECQVCFERIEVGKGQFYSEVHHIQPLGTHNGPDISENMIVLCPNHHIMFDKGVIRINTLEKKVYHYNKNHVLNGREINLRHNIHEIYTNYHDSHIFKDSINQKLEKEKIKKVSYGDIVVFWDGEEENEVLLETYHNRHFMNNMQRMLFSKQEGEEFLFNGFTYRIIKIK
ncbi:HNH endonuclease [Priestia megaterium]